jgi:hypothetical protein
VGDKEEQPPQSGSLLVEPCTAPPYLDCSMADGSSGATTSSNTDRPSWAVAISTSAGEDGDEEEKISQLVTGRGSGGSRGQVWRHTKMYYRLETY